MGNNKFTQHNYIKNPLTKKIKTKITADLLR